MSKAKNEMRNLAKIMINFDISSVTCWHSIVPSSVLCNVLRLFVLLLSVKIVFLLLLLIHKLVEKANFNEQQVELFYPKFELSARIFAQLHWYPFLSTRNYCKILHFIHNWVRTWLICSIYVWTTPINKLGYSPSLNLVSSLGAC